MAWNWLIDPPEADASLEEWEAFLADLLTLDQSDEGVAYSVREARVVIARRRREVGINRPA